MLKKYSSAISSIFFLLVGIVAIYLAIKNQDISKLYATIKAINFYWYFPVLIATILCHYWRAKRWQLLLQSRQEQISTFDCLNALMSAYVVNFITGKLGEVYRCLVVNRKNAVSFPHAIATVILERVIDVLSLFFLCFICLMLFQQAILDFFQRFMLPVFHSIPFPQAAVLLVLIVFLVVVIWVFMYRRRSTKYVQVKLRFFLESMRSLLQLKERKLFFIYTLLIWLMYLAMTYFWFFAFDDAHLSIGTALLVIVIGGIGRSLPVPAHGLGTYHICATFALSACAVEALQATSIPIVIHAGQTLFYLIFGSISMLFISVRKISFKNQC